jgi:flavin reductase (DIM6/NTAB) family NADH-FMN oxidoreductase RutF
MSEQTSATPMNLGALRNIGYGMYIIGARKGDRLNAQIANTLFQITSEPPTVAVSINKGNLTHEFIKESRAFSASILAEDTPLTFIGRFGFKSGRVTGSPVVLDNVTACLEIKVSQEVDLGTHTIFIGAITAADVISDKASMSYAYYHQVKRGTTPKAAPSYVAQK